VRQHTELSADAGHAIDCATGFVLSERKSALAEDGGHAGRSIRNHSSHDYTESTVLKDLRDGVHKKVNRP
jgi:hypothetical protein